MKLQQLGYIVVGCADFDAWRELSEDILGMECVDGDDKLYLRMDDYHHRIIVDRTLPDGIQCVGWQVKDMIELAGAADELGAAGVEHGVAKDEERDSRFVRNFLHFQDPSGVRVEIFHGLAFHTGSFRPGRAHHGFVTGDAGMGHAVLNVSPEMFAPMHDFYVNVLGMTVASYGKTKMTGVPAAFYRCNSRQHSFAIIVDAGDIGFHHFFVEAKSLDDVGLAIDLVREHGVKQVTELGRHAADSAVSFYAETPSRVFVEYGWGARRIDDEERECDPVWFGRPTVWGLKWLGDRSPRKFAPESDAR